MVANVVAIFLALIWVAALTVILGSSNTSKDINSFADLFRAAEGR